MHTYLRGSFSSPEQAFFVFRGAEGTEKVLPVEALGERTFDQNGNPARSEFSFLFGRNGSVCSVSTLDGKKLFETNAWESDPVRLGLRLEKRIEDDPREQELKAPEAVQLGIEELLVTRERTGFASREGEGGYDQKVAALLNQQ